MYTVPWVLSSATNLRTALFRTVSSIIVGCPGINTVNFPSLEVKGFQTELAAWLGEIMVVATMLKDKDRMVKRFMAPNSFSLLYPHH
jgi:hypothetical protein